MSNITNPIISKAANSFFILTFGTIYILPYVWLSYLSASYIRSWSNSQLAPMLVHCFDAIVHLISVPFSLRNRQTTVLKWIVIL